MGKEFGCLVKVSILLRGMGSVDVGGVCLCTDLVQMFVR